MWLEYERRWMQMWRRVGDDYRLNRAIGSYYFIRAQSHGNEVASFEKAMEWFGRNLQKNPRDKESMRDMALVHKHLINPKDGKGALLHAGEALRLDRQRLKEDATDAGARVDLGFSLVAYANALEWAGDRTGAEKYFEEGHELRKAMAQADPSNVFARQSLLYPMRAWAGLMLAKKHWEKAKELLVEEVEWLRKFGVEFSAGVEMELALYRGRLEEGLGGEGCQEYRRAGEWRKKAGASYRWAMQGQEELLGSMLRRCGVE